MCLDSIGLVGFIHKVAFSVARKTQETRVRTDRSAGVITSKLIMPKRVLISQKRKSHTPEGRANLDAYIEWRRNGGGGKRRRRQSRKKNDGAEGPGDSVAASSNCDSAGPPVPPLVRPPRPPTQQGEGLQNSRARGHSPFTPLQRRDLLSQFGCEEEASFTSDATSFNVGPPVDTADGLEPLKERMHALLDSLIDGVELQRTFLQDIIADPKFGEVLDTPAPTRITAPAARYTDLSSLSNNSEATPLDLQAFATTLLGEERRTASAMM